MLAGNCPHPRLTNKLYFSTMKKIITKNKDYFKSLETDAIKYTVTIMDAESDRDKQYQQVDDFIKRKVDVMIINLVLPWFANAITEKARTANIPVVYINRKPDEDDMKSWDKICYVGAVPRQNSTYQGEIIRDLPDHGDVDGDGVVRYVMIMGDPESTVELFHLSNFPIKTLTDAGIEVIKQI
jgi:methyl-galactoside transport system substrate-binding protein